MLAGASAILREALESKTLIYSPDNHLEIVAKPWTHIVSDPSKTVL
jgi:hypothetical protein